MNIHFFYRSAPESKNRPGRPSFFSKYICLRSFLDAYQGVSPHSTLTFINDGKIEERCLQLMDKHGEVITNEPLGNIGSLKFTLEHIFNSQIRDTDFIYLAEDDYFYLPNAFKTMNQAVHDITELDYLTLYDHPDRYRRDDDAGGGKSKIFVTSNRHWRTVESTTYTFGARLAILRKDYWLFRLAMLPKNTPRDREMFRAIQGIGKYALKFPKRNLVSPMPSLATHAVSNFMAPVINWEEVINDIIP